MSSSAAMATGPAGDHPRRKAWRLRARRKRPSRRGRTATAMWRAIARPRRPPVVARKLWRRSPPSASPPWACRCGPADCGEHRRICPQCSWRPGQRRRRRAPLRQGRAAGAPARRECGGGTTAIAGRRLRHPLAAIRQRGAAGAAGRGAQFRGDGDRQGDAAGQRRPPAAAATHGGACARGIACADRRAGPGADLGHPTLRVGRQRHARLHRYAPGLCRAESGYAGAPPISAKAPPGSADLCRGSTGLHRSS